MSKEIPADIHVENTDSGEITLAEVRFFEAKRDAFPLYESLRTAILQNCGPTEIQVKKTQISFVNRHLFGAVSFTPVRRAKERPDPYITVTFSLSYRIDSTRIDAAVEARGAARMAARSGGFCLLETLAIPGVHIPYHHAIMNRSGGLS